MTYAIDFDGVLTNTKMQFFVRKLIAERNDVWIVTKRRDGEHNVDLFKVCDFIKLPTFKIIFTNNKYKAEFLVGLNVDVFIDNETDEFEYLMRYSNVVPLNFTSND
jgi:hypothetical protein